MLAAIPRFEDPNVLVGFGTADDAGVYQLTPECALVQTVDFFTPIVDDPYTFGAIAAANSLSDVYAMGALPRTALSIVAFPDPGDASVLADIVRGGAEKMHEGGCAVIGGHSVNDEQIKFGYAVTGIIHPQRVISNAGAKPGDALVLTKPIGTGVIATAAKRGLARAEHLGGAIESMLRLNRDACVAMIEGGAHSATDITGFGLLGHAREMALASGVCIQLMAGAVPLLPGAEEYVRRGAVPGGLRNNSDFLSSDVRWPDGISEEVRTLLADPQTSGGLLIAAPPERARDIAARIEGARVIGSVTEAGGTPIEVLV